jgi:hypothetical protein
MHKKELIEAVAKRTGKSQKDVKETLEAILSTINETMKKGEWLLPRQKRIEHFATTKYFENQIVIDW